MTKARTDYLAFLLRLWREDESADWRATLESSHTGERRGFASLSALAAYLRETTTADSPGPDEPDAPTEPQETPDE
ncbi:MAG: hypothetical protein IT317_13535 [Anaerolineales bacterium]|nr:hypothetical protein [Anaerolineales bacterium]